MSDLNIVQKYTPTLQSLSGKGQFYSYEMGDYCFFFLDSLIDIQISHCYQYLEFKFTISGENKFAPKTDDPRHLLKYECIFKVNKFDIAKLYNFKHPKSLDDMPLFLYDNNGQNVLIKSDETSSNILAKTEFYLADGINRQIMLPSYDRDDIFYLKISLKTLSTQAFGNFLKINTLLFKAAISSP